jgi:hypothetical protein
MICFEAYPPYHSVMDRDAHGRFKRADLNDSQILLLPVQEIVTGEGPEVHIAAKTWDFWKLSERYPLRQYHDRPEDDILLTGTFDEVCDVDL